MVEFLLQYTPPLGSDPNSQAHDKRTALHRAAFNGHVEVCEMLLKAGADPRVKDKMGETCFDVATDPKIHEYLDSWNEEDVVEIM